MRSPARIAVAVRRPSGRIAVKAEPFVSLTKRYRALKIPVLRGAVALIETLAIAIKALSFSADQAVAEEGAEENESSRGGVSSFHMALTVIAALALGLTIFFYLPLLLTELAGLESGILFNITDGAIRLAFLFLYIVAIARWKQMQRIFEYHGAEHKTIFTFEGETEITPENVAQYPRVHPRCGTSFLLLVVIVSVIVFIVLGRPVSVGDRLVRFAFIPVIGGVAYELLRVSSNPSVRRYTGLVIWPGLFLQRFTTREPSRDQIEVAIAALKACLGDKKLEH